MNGGLNIDGSGAALLAAVACTFALAVIGQGQGIAKLFQFLKNLMDRKHGKKR